MPRASMRRANGRTARPSHPAGWTPEEVKGLRQALNRTQVEFAALLGVTFSTVNRWENGRVGASPLAVRELNALLNKARWRKGRERA